MPLRFRFDTLGRLVNDSAPDGRATGLAVVTTDTMRTVTLTTAMGRVTTHRVKPNAKGELFRMIADPAGLTTTALEGVDGSVSSTLPDSTTVTVVQGADPRFGMQAPFLKSFTTRLGEAIRDHVGDVKLVERADEQGYEALVRHGLSRRNTRRTSTSACCGVHSGWRPRTPAAVRDQA
jgi:hypothetical protein